MKVYRTDTAALTQATWATIVIDVSDDLRQNHNYEIHCYMPWTGRVVRDIVDVNPDQPKIEKRYFWSAGPYEPIVTLLEDGIEIAVDAPASNLYHNGSHQ